MSRLNTDWDGNELLLSDILGTEGDMIYRSIEDQVDRDLLKQAINHLSGRDRAIVRLAVWAGRERRKRPRKEVADLLGISQSYISRLEKRIIAQLRRGNPADWCRSMPGMRIGKRIFFAAWRVKNQPTRNVLSFDRGYPKIAA